MYSIYAVIIIHNGRFRFLSSMCRLSTSSEDFPVLEYIPSTLQIVLKPWINLWGFLYICIYFMTCSDTNYLHIQIKTNPEKLIAIMNANVFIYGAPKLLSRN